jgi:hypothetical protein
VAVSALVLVVLFGVVLAALGSGDLGLREVIRLSARTSLLLFVLAFVASSLARLRPSPRTKWLLRSRRYVGLSFAVSHGLHGLAIAWLASTVPRSLAALGPISLIGGVVGYVFVLAMAATSFDRTTAWLGLRWWRRLHTTGMYVLWIVFFASYAPTAAAGMPLGILLSAILLAALAVRFLAHRKNRGS